MCLLHTKYMRSTKTSHKDVCLLHTKDPSVSALVPAAVRALTLAGRGTDDLRVTWAAAPGDVDHYEVQLLFNDLKVFPPVTLGSGVGECVLSSLTPGRMYKVLVSTFSGPNQRAQFIEGRTGQELTPSPEEGWHPVDGASLRGGGGCRHCSRDEALPPARKQFQHTAWALQWSVGSLI